MKLKQYDATTSTWRTLAQGSGSSTGGSGTTFDTDFSIKMSAAKTVANITTTKIDKFDTIVIDSNSEWDAINLRWTCVDAGTYVICAVIAWDASSTGYRNVYVYVDGAAVQARTYNNAGANTAHSSITYKTALTAGQYVEIYGRHAAGGNLDAIVGSPAVEWQIWRVK